MTDNRQPDERYCHRCKRFVPLATGTTEGLLGYALCQDCLDRDAAWSKARAKYLGLSMRAVAFLRMVCGPGDVWHCRPYSRYGPGVTTRRDIMMLRDLGYIYPLGCGEGKPRVFRPRSKHWEDWYAWKATHAGEEALKDAGRYADETIGRIA